MHRFGSRSRRSEVVVDRVGIGRKLVPLAISENQDKIPANEKDVVTRCLRMLIGISKALDEPSDTELFSELFQQRLQEEVEKANNLFGDL